MPYRFAGLCAFALLAACGAEDGVPIGADEEMPARTAEAARGTAEDAQGPVAASDGFARPVRAGAPSTAAYLRLRAERDDALIGARSDAFDAAEIHTVDTEDGIMRMRRVDRVALPAGETVALSPGGRHIMLMGPHGPLAEGETLPLTLSFESGASLDLNLPVEVRDPG